MIPLVFLKREIWGICGGKAPGFSWMYFLSFSTIIFAQLSCQEKSHDSSLDYSDSTLIEPDKDFQFFKAKYIANKFYVLRDFGSVIRVYAKDSILSEMNIVKLQQSGNTYILAGVGSTIDFFVVGQKIICFQKIPNQVKVLDINSGEILESSVMDLPMNWAIQQVERVSTNEFLLQVFDPDHPKVLRIYRFDYDTKRLGSFLEEEMARSTDGGVLALNGTDLMFLGKSEKIIYRFDINNGEPSNLEIPELDKREYQERPEFKSENPFEWMDLSREERVEYRTDHYRDLYFKDNTVYLSHYVYQRKDFDLNWENFVYSKNQLGKPADVVGFLKGCKYLEFDGLGNYIAVMERSGGLMLIVNPLENLEKTLLP